MEAAEVSRPRRRRMAWVAGVAALVVLGLLGAALWLRAQILGSQRGAPREIWVPQGASLSEVVNKLAASGVVGNGLLFRAWLALHSPPEVLAGIYQMRTNEPYSEVLSTLRRGPVVYHLLVPPGFDLAQILARIEGFFWISRSACQQALKSVSSPYLPSTSSGDPEGVLFPDTYYVWAGEPCSEILNTMAHRFVTEAASAGITPSTRLFGLDAYQLITVASIVEREAKLQVDRPLVAEVIYNRLRRHMDLQMDSTVLYGLGRHSGRLDAADLAKLTPYNTYLVGGLPPTPIAVPSLSSLEAALHPARGDLLYFVVVARDGAEAFSATYAGQERNIALAERNLGERL